MKIISRKKYKALEEELARLRRENKELRKSVIRLMEENTKLKADNGTLNEKLHFSMEIE